MKYRKRKRSTARSAGTKPQSKYVPIRVRQRKQADRVGEGQHIHVVEHLYSALFPKRTKKSKSARPTAITNYSHSASVMRERSAFSFDLSKIQHSSLSVFSMFRACMRRPSCYPGAWSSLGFASHQFAPNIVELSVRVIHSRLGPFFLESEPSGRRKPERSALYFLISVLSSSVGSIGISLASQSSRLNNASFCYLPGSLFPLLLFFRRRALFFQFLFLWPPPFFFVRACCRRYIYRKHSAARSALCTQRQSKCVPTLRRQCEQAGRVGESREPACRRALVQLAVFSKRTEK